MTRPGPQNYSPEFPTLLTHLMEELKPVDDLGPAADRLKALGMNVLVEVINGDQTLCLLSGVAGLPSVSGLSTTVLIRFCWENEITVCFTSTQKNRWQGRHSSDLKFEARLYFL